MQFVLKEGTINAIMQNLTQQPWLSVNALINDIDKQVAPQRAMQQQNNPKKDAAEAPKA